MRLSHIAVISWLIYAGFTFAADVRLGPETAVTRDSTDVQPAPFDQTIPSVASNGRDFLAVWTDERDRGTSAIYLSRVDAEGRPFIPGGRKFADYGTAKLASNGIDYLIAWWDGRNTHTQRLDRDGNAIGEAHTIGIYPPYALASNGSSYLCVAEGTVLLDRDGRIVRRVAFDAYPQSLTTRDGAYRMVDDDGRKVWSLTIDDSGRIERTLLDIPPTGFILTATDGDSSTLLAWDPYPDYRARFTLADAHGHTAPPTLLDVPVYSHPIFATWDGNEFLLLLRRYDSIDVTLYVVRISRHGIVRDKTPIVLSPAGGYDGGVSFASNGTTSMLVWSDRRFGHGSDIVARSFSGFSELAAPSNAVRIVSMSGRAQLGMQIAFAGSHRMAVWNDDANRTIDGALDGMELPIASSEHVIAPSIAAGDDSFLVAWTDIGLRARRFAFHGTPLDAQPLVLFLYAPNQERPGILFDGTSFIVAAPWLNSMNSIGIARVDPHTAAITTSSSRGFATRVQPLSAERLAFNVRSALYVSEPKSFGDRLVISTNDTRIPFDVSGALGRLTFAYGKRQEVTLLRTSSEGYWIGLPYRVRREGFVGDVAMAWNGAHFVVVWTEVDATHATQSLQAMRFDSDLNPVDEAPFAIVERGVVASTPVVLATPDGVLIGYSRIDENNRNAPRAFTRTLFR